jgi:Tat protein secretion system quality control protein TatD with DNase activity
MTKGGHKEMVNNLLKIPKLGRRFYFGFSTVINIHDTTGPSEKLVEAIKAVPDNRILLESDWNAARAIDTASLEIHRLVAECKVRLNPAF